MKINIEEILGIVSRLRQINSTPLESIEFYYQDNKVEVPTYLVEEFKFTGLSNIDFIKMDVVNICGDKNVSR